MALLQQRLTPSTHAQERRRHQRVRVNLLGRYMLADRQEYPCQVVNMSPGGMALIAPTIGQVGERVIAYIDHLGRLEGAIARMLVNGFAMTISATPRKRDKLAAQLTWLANRHILNLPEDRRHGRFVPRNPRLDADPAERHRSSAAASSTCRCRAPPSRCRPHLRPEIGAVVTLGKVAGRVVRHLEDGFAVEFTRLQHPDLIEESVAARF